MENNGAAQRHVQCAISELGLIELIEVNGSKDRNFAVWRNLIRDFHYIGRGILFGRQIRYLIRCENYGWIGALSFSSAAWKLKDRDAWIGWDNNTRLRNLDKIICNSRFLILPNFKVENLASCALAMGLNRVKADWRIKYNVEPVLVETFVENGRFKGTCYKAANFKKAGETAGRGRQDYSTKRNLPVKDIFLYPLVKEADKILRGGMEPIVKTSVQPADWAEEEFGKSDLGDARLNKRLFQIARDFYSSPTSNIPEASKSRAGSKAAYRFFDNDQVTMDKVLESHYESTIQRMGKENIVLAVQDTTSLNYSTHPMTDGLGPVGTSEENIGLIVHDTLVFNLEGTPLGLLNVQCWARDKEEYGKRHDRRKNDIENKESVKWLKSFGAAVEARGKCPETRIISVGDRESDIYALFRMAVENPEGADLLIRAQHNRQTADESGYVWDILKAKPESGIQQLRVPRKGNSPARDAELTIRYSEVDLKAPRHGKEKGNVKLWAIHAEEENSPEGVDPLKWMLLTTIPLQSFEDAVEKLEWYSKRWGIEIYHKTLKSGCKIEDRQLGNADRIEGCLAVDMVIAWRIYYLTKLGREVPEVPCSVFFEEAEWKALFAYKTNSPAAPENPPTLKEAVRIVASIGGFLGRKSDGEPGTETIWRGLQALDNMTTMWKIFNQKEISPAASP